MSNRKIVQIIPCEPGWYARYKLDDGGFLNVRLACMALTEEPYDDENPNDGMFQDLLGLHLAVDGCAEADVTSNFEDYKFCPNHTEHWFEEKESEQ